MVAIADRLQCQIFASVGLARPRKVQKRILHVRKPYPRDFRGLLVHIRAGLGTGSLIALQLPGNRQAKSSHCLRPQNAFEKPYVSRLLQGWLVNRAEQLLPCCNQRLGTTNYFTAMQALAVKLVTTILHSLYIAQAG
jgi:trans-aconitate methyltransferase